MTKRWRLRWINDRLQRPSYICWSFNDIKISHDPSNPITIYTDEELQTLKSYIPHLAPAIDAMKEPVEDDK